MSISSVYIGNFKGFGKEVKIEIKPITVVIGANSSGKSSLIHALAAMAQTSRVTTDTRPLVLDDEFAYVHLGRFIEVIHSKKYDDAITLGVGIKDVDYHVFGEKFQSTVETAEGIQKLNYKCSLRTQEVSIEKGFFSVGKNEYDLSKNSKKSLIVRQRSTNLSFPVSRSNGTSFDLDMALLPPNEETFFRTFPFKELSIQINRELRNTLYLGPFRQAPARRYASRGANPTEVGAMGESAVTLLANEAIQSRSRPNSKKIHHWLQELGLAKSINVSRIGTSDLFDVSLELPKGGTFPLADLGYGLSQVLPVLVQCSFAPEGSTLLFEQPEIHLHSLAARQLATVFRDTVQEKNASVIIETHAPELVKQLFTDVRNGDLSKDDLVVYRVSRENGASVIKAIEQDEFGDVYDNWERGVSVP